MVGELKTSPAMAFIERVMEMAPCGSPETNTPWAWIAAPCPQHMLISCIHLLFTSLTCLTGSMASHKRSRRSSPPVQVALIALVMLSNWCVATWRVVRAPHVPAHELIYSLTQSLAWTVFFATVFFAADHQKRRLLRAWWITTTFLSLLTLYTTFYKWNDPHLWVDGVLCAAAFPVVVVLTLKQSHVSDGDEDGGLSDSLLGSETEEVAGFASASFISKTLWLWLNLLLQKGASLKVEDVPLIADEDWFDSRFEGETIRRALLHTFWPRLVATAVLALLNLSVMFLGPVLIVEFVSLRFGVALVAILFMAKTVETLSARHLSFHSRRLGMSARASLTRALYTKALCRRHGGGRDALVDVQHVGELMAQLHNLWVLPLQAAASLATLLAAVGVSCLGGLLVMVCILVVSFNVGKRHRGYRAMAMKFKAKRVGVTAEVLNNIKNIKLQVWEDLFKEKIESIRESERTWLARFMYVVAMNVFFLWLSPLAVSTATFALCVFLKVPLTPAKAFTALSTFRILHEPVRLFPQALMAISQGLRSCDRLQSFMMSEEVDAHAVERLPLGGEYDVEIEDGSFQWEGERGTLKDVNVKVPHGAFVAVAGLAGSGKSALLSAILGEIPKLSGSVKVRGRTAYVGKSAWIQNATIKDNILFGKELDEAKYQESLRVCSLTQDLAQMTLGDKTEIGERGINNLSEGQQQKIQLARAVYQDSDVYILDDVFSAVDAQTSRDLFKECIMGALSEKTVLLVTHQVEFLHEADLILVMRNGEIVQSGNYSELLEAGTDFGALMAEGFMDLVETDVPFVVVDSSTNVSQNADHLLKSLSKVKISDKAVLAGRSGKALGKAAFFDNEKQTSGQVGLGAYLLYARKAFKGLHILALVILHSCWQGLQIASDYWLAQSTADPATFRPLQFITTYSELALGSGLFVLLRSLFTAFVGLVTAQSFFVSLLSSILRARMAFFDSTPTGRILTRFASDQSNVDFLLPILMGTVLGQGFQALGILAVICQVTWQMVFLILPLAYVYFMYQRSYIATSRELTRMDAMTNAPITTHFSEMISGLVTIRAFGEQPRFAAAITERVDANLRVDFHNNAVNEWLGLRLEMIGNVVLASSALFMVTAARNIIQPGLVGLALSYGLALNKSLCGVAHLACQVDTKMVSVECINQFCEVASEAAQVIEDSHLAQDWPSQGSIQFERLQLPPALEEISLTIKGGERVAVLGSGKSALMHALFRLAEPSHGRVLIDALDTQRIGVRDLRMKLGIVPRDPALFEGTVRSNVDPLRQHSDPEIWEALAKCELAGLVRNRTGKLDSSGENWSVGQRQLFCLSRALVKKARILVLEEAVDMQTNIVVQRIIRSDLAQSTVISIAPRIPSVMDCDRVLVLESGVVKEFDVPSRRLAQQNSVFAALVRELSEPIA